MASSKSSELNFGSPSSIRTREKSLAIPYLVIVVVEVVVGVVVLVTT